MPKLLASNLRYAKGYSYEIQSGYEGKWLRPQFGFANHLVIIRPGFHLPRQLEKVTTLRSIYLI